MSDRNWFLHYNLSQQGPFRIEEIREKLGQQEINLKTYAWKRGMRDWVRIVEIPELSALLSEPQTPAEKAAPVPAPVAVPQAAKPKIISQVVTKFIPKKLIKPAAEIPGMPAPVQPAPSAVAAPPDRSAEDLRRSPRRPLLARVISTDQKIVSLGMCRDINEGGILVLTDVIPGAVGTALSINMSPAETEADSIGLKPFVAQGKIVRILPEGNGYGFEFESLDEKDRKTIRDFIASHK